MRKLIAIGTATALLLPALTFALYNDVTLTTSTVLSVNGITINISGSSAVVETITVGSTNFSFTLASGSSIEMTAPNRNVLSVDTTTYQVTNVCTGTESKRGYTASGALTVTITPETSLCASASGGGGGGGGGSTTTTTTVAATTTAATSTAVVATTTATTTPKISPALPTIASLQAQLAGLLAQLQALKGRAAPNANAYANASANASFNRNLQVGSTGADVKALQVYLNTHGYVVASNGAGSSGNETTRFGGLTRAALIKLQKAAGITPAAGYLGPKTRAYIAANP